MTIPGNLIAKRTVLFPALKWSRMQNRVDSRQPYILSVRCVLQQNTDQTNREPGKPRWHTASPGFSNAKLKRRSNRQMTKPTANKSCKSSMFLNSEISLKHDWSWAALYVCLLKNKYVCKSRWYSSAHMHTLHDLKFSETIWSEITRTTGASWTN